MVDEEKDLELALDRDYAKQEEDEELPFVEYEIVDILEHHLNNDAIMGYSATLVNKETGKRMDVELSENNQGVFAYCWKNDILYPLVTDKKHIADLQNNEQVEIEIAIERTDK